jgi:hypothetical protein
MGTAFGWVFFAMAMLLYIGVSRRLNFAVHHWRPYCAVLAMVGVGTVYFDDSPLRPIVGITYVIALLGALLWRDRRKRSTTSS